MEMKFYRCKHCGQIIAVVKKTGVPVMCCGEPMEEIVAGTTDAAVEKHVPVFEVEGEFARVLILLEQNFVPQVQAVLHKCFSYLCIQ